jgi:acyl dehydratase
VQVCDVFELGAVIMDRASILAFAALYDPQPFHLDEGAAGRSVFRGLVASGLQTLAVVQGLAVRSGVLERIGAIAGLGMDKVRLPRPVRPDDELRATMEVLNLTSSRSRPGRGVARCRLVAANQHGEPVVTYESSMLVQLERWEAV